MFKGSTASPDLTQVVRALKSAAEPTRLRLLVLLSHGEFTVGELCAVLAQSQPRISRHLRLLTEAGFLERFREQQCVYYRAPVVGRYLEWSRQLLSMLEPDAAVLKRDRERAAEVVQARAAIAAQQLTADQSAGVEDPREELNRVLLEELGPTSVDELLDIGTGSGLMLEVLARRAGHAVGIDISAPALRVARTRIHGAGLTHCEFRRGDMYSLPIDDGAFDLVTMDRVLTLAAQPTSVLREAARALRGEGRLLAIEDFDQLEARLDTNPLLQMRDWLLSAGLSCVRLRPCDIGGRHLIIALARHGSHRAAPLATTLPRVSPIVLTH
jgi:DNA-binding transcriptional ArsR family regulator